MARIPDAETILRIHYELVEIFKEDNDPIFPSGPKDENLVYSAASRPHTGIGGFEKYETLETKTAALFHSLVQNHPFHNGNKRTALVSMLVCLEANGRRLEASDDDVFEHVVSVAGHVAPYIGQADNVVEEIANWIKTNTRTRQFAPSSMRTTDFLDSCERVGCQYRESGGSWVISSPTQKSIRISKSTKALEGRVVKTYLNRLNLSESQTGIYLDEFQDGMELEQRHIILRYRSVLKRLANA